MEQFNNGQTTLTFRFLYFNIEVRIRGGGTSRMRRQVALALFRQLKPVLGELALPNIHHSETWSLCLEPRKGSDRQAIPVGHGFEIRMRRMMIGLSQQSLADRVGLSRSQISRIEHGRCRPRESTVRQITAALQNPSESHYAPEVLRKARLRKKLDRDGEI